MQRNRLAWTAFWAVVMMILSGCFTLKRHDELVTANFVDVGRVVGTWYVQGAMTTLLDRNPTDATFTFFSAQDGSMRVEYQFKPAPVDSDRKLYTAKVKVDDLDSHADWSIQFLWPFENDYRVVFVSDDYKTMIIGHPTRKYLYIISREKHLDYTSMEWLLDLAASRGFDTSYLKRVPQS